MILELPGAAEGIISREHRALDRLVSLLDLGSQSAEDHFGGRIERDRQRARRSQRVRVPDLFRDDCAPASRDDHVCLFERAQELSSLDLPESRLTVLGKDLRDALLFDGLDLMVDIDRSPAELTRDECRDGALAGAAEPS
jgi:hypothetical protein